jgi:hypothetical protein
MRGAVISNSGRNYFKDGCLTKGLHLMGWATTTSVFLWLFPCLFMIHEFEEIILVGAWKKRDLCSYAK